MPREAEHCSCGDSAQLQLAHQIVLVSLPLVLAVYEDRSRRYKTTCNCSSA